MSEVELLPMNERQFQDYLELAIPRYAQENIKAGYRTEEEAEPRSREDFLKLLPQGLETPGNHLLVVRSKTSGKEIGAVWIKVEEGSRRTGFIYEVFLDEEHRGKGLGKATMRALEEFARSKGVVALYLHVFAHNKVAIHLYEESGYRTKSMNMEKVLDG